MTHAYNFPVNALLAHSPENGAKVLAEFTQETKRDIEAERMRELSAEEFCEHEEEEEYYNPRPEENQ